MAKRVTQVGIRFTYPERKVIKEIAAREQRSESVVVRLLVERGLRQYQRDGALVEPDDTAGKAGTNHPE